MIRDLATFKKNSAFYKPKAFLVTVKSFELQKIRERYLRSKAAKTGRIGSVERRPSAKGGLVYLEIDQGLITYYEILSFLTEPRGIDVTPDRIAVSTENVVHVISRNKVERIDNPWFSYIHTVQFNHRHDPDRLLISSSGFDCIFEYDLGRYENTWEWFAWEHGFRKGYDPAKKQDVLLTRNALEASEWRKQKVDYLFISDPEKQILPTAQRAAFINSVVYDTKKAGWLLATLFHEGAVHRINMNSGETEKIIDGMKSPHGGRNYRDGYMATSTATGEIRFSHEDSIDVRNLKGKPPELYDLEWLQNTAVFDDCLITIDANRNAFLLIEPDRGLYDMISYDPQWAIQDIAEVRSEKTKKLVKSLKEKL